MNRRVKKINHILLARMVKLIHEESHTINELVEKTGLHATTVGDYLAAMRKEKIAYIESWEPDTRGRLTCMSIRLGAQKDRPRPPRVPPAQRQAKTRAKRKAAQLLAVMGGQGTFTQQRNGRVAFSAVRSTPDTPDRCDGDRPGCLSPDSSSVARADESVRVSST